MDPARLTGLDDPQIETRRVRVGQIRAVGRNRPSGHRDFGRVGGELLNPCSRGRAGKDDPPATAASRLQKRQGVDCVLELDADVGHMVKASRAALTEAPPYHDSHRCQQRCRQQLPVGLVLENGCDRLRDGVRRKRLDVR